MTRLGAWLRRIERAFSLSVAIALIALVLSWLGDGPSRVAGIPLLDPEFAGSMPPLVRALLLVTAFSLVPIFMLAGRKFVVGRDRERSTLVLVWALLKIPIVGILFFSSFTALTVFAGASNLGRTLSDVLVLVLAIMVGCFLSLMASGIRHAAGTDDIGRAMSSILVLAHTVTAGFAAGGIRGGVISAVGISGVMSIGLGGAGIVFALFFLLPGALTLAYLASWALSEWLYQRLAGWTDSRSGPAILATVLNVALSAGLSMVIVIGAAEIYNGLVDSTAIPWRAYAARLYDHPWSQFPSTMLMLLWTITGAIAVCGATIFECRVKGREALR